MGKRILVSLNLILICFCTVSAQSDANPTTKPFPSKPVTVVTPKGVTTTKTAAQTAPSVKTTTNVKPPVVAGKGLTTAKAATQPPKAKVAPKPPVKTTAKAATKTPVKGKTAVAAKTTKSKTTTKTAVKTTTKAKIPTAATTVKAKTPASTPANTKPVAAKTTVQTKSVPTQYTTAVVKKTPQAAVVIPQTPMSFNKEMLVAVNALRKSGTTCGGEKMPPVKPLAWSAQLENAAEVHVTDMDANDHFSHAGTNGTLPDDRIKAAGYEWARVGENIGQGYKNVSAAIKGWKESPNHCKQMMNADMTNIGAAKKGKYWCQTFASPLD